MYAFNNSNKLKSIFSINENDYYKKTGEPEISATKFDLNKNSDTIGYKYFVQINQAITLADTTKIGPVETNLSLLLYACENNFHNISDIDITF